LSFGPVPLTWGNFSAGMVRVHELSAGHTRLCQNYSFSPHRIQERAGAHKRDKRGIRLTRRVRRTTVVASPARLFGLLGQLFVSELAGMGQHIIFPRPAPAVASIHSC